VDNEVQIVDIEPKLINESQMTK